MSYELETKPSNGAKDSLRKIVTARRLAYGAWCMIPSAFVGEVLSASGCDWLCVDLQHGLLSEDVMRLIVQAAAIRNTPVMVRVGWNEPGAIMRALDAGAEGVIVPMVNSPSEARNAVSACRYPPMGYRSWGPLRSTMARADFSPRVGNDQTVCLVMVETIEAVASLGEILDIEGIDGIFTGPTDLSISQSGSPDGVGRSVEHLGLMERIATETVERGLVAGTTCRHPEDVVRWQGMGYTLLALSSDAAVLSRGMSAELAAARATQVPG